VLSVETVAVYRNCQIVNGYFVSNVMRSHVSMSFWMRSSHCATHQVERTANRYERCAVQMPQKHVEGYRRVPPPSSSCWWTSLTWFSTDRRKLKTWLTLLELRAQVEVFVPIVHSAPRVVTSGQVDHQTTSVQLYNLTPDMW
jgi:hypothetical protein